MVLSTPGRLAPGSAPHVKARMGKLLAAALVMGAVVAGASPVVPEREHEPVAGARPAGLVPGASPVVPAPDHEVEVCAGSAVTPFERSLPERVRRFVFDGALLEPFLRLWQSGDRPELPMSPESVIVYAAPGRPYVVGYERHGCMIALLAVQYRELWHWLRPSVGWLAELPGPPVTRGRA
jgi:hypothetical protein